MTIQDIDSVVYVTGSEAGISGEEQIRIALDVIIQHDGTAKMNQIIKAVEETVIARNPNYRLSEQGKASLRFFVNKVAVNAEYIYKYDPRSPGWRITPKGREYINSLLPNNQPYTKMLTPIGNDFQLALLDVYALLNADKQLSQDATSVAVAFIRAGVILTVTAWETFIEDTIKAHFLKKVNSASKPDDLSNIFNSVVAAWLDDFGEKRPKSPDIMKWTGDGWKTMLIDYFKSDISTFHTPKSENISNLFKRYLRYDIKSIWQWQDITSDDACKKLDEVVTIRGGLVHRGRTSAEPTLNINREQLIQMITLVEQLVWATEVELNIKLL